MPDPRQCTVVPPGQGNAYWVLGDLVTFKLGPEQTSARFSVAETIAPPNSGPPPHLHSREDELFAFIDGNFQVISADKSFTVRGGQVAYLPKQIIHTYKNVGQSPAKFLVIATPPGFEKFIAEIGLPAKDPTTPPPVTGADIGRLMGATPRFGIEMHPDHQTSTNNHKLPAPAQYWVLGQHVQLHLGSAQTAGNFCVITITMPPGSGVAPHLHHREDEMFYVLDGTVVFTLGDRTLPAGPGTFIHVPAGIPHAIANPGRAPAMMLDYHTPGGFERFITDFGTPADDAISPPVPFDPARARKVMSQYGMET